MKTDLIIIGGGLVGSMIAKLATKNELSYVIIDSSEPLAASKCSFGLFKEGWINESIQPFYKKGLILLESVCDGIQPVEMFDMKKEKFVPMKWVDCSKILNEKVIKDRVKSVGNKVVFLESGDIIECDKAIIIAAGAYTNEILNASSLKSRPIDKYWGATMDVSLSIDENRIFEWAPYRQCMLLKNDKGGFMFGNGTAVKNPKLDDVRVKNASERLQQHLNLVTGVNVSNDNISAVNEGNRPYLPKGTYDYVVQHSRNVFSVTGGAKNSTILAPYMALSCIDKIYSQ